MNVILKEIKSHTPALCRCCMRKIIKGETGLHLISIKCNIKTSVNLCFSCIGYMNDITKGETNGSL